METTRQQKIAKLVQKDLAEIFLAYANELYKGKMVTITVVRITPDLGLAKVYLSVFPSDNSKQIVEAINARQSNIRGDLGRKIRHQLRKVPDLKFYLDDSLDYIEGIDNALNEE